MTSFTFQTKVFACLFWTLPWDCGRQEVEPWNRIRPNWSSCPTPQPSAWPNPCQMAPAVFRYLRKGAPTCQQGALAHWTLATCVDTSSTKDHAILHLLLLVPRRVPGIYKCLVVVCSVIDNSRGIP